jgi:hypothetical protein
MKNSPRRGWIPSLRFLYTYYLTHSSFRTDKIIWKLYLSASSYSAFRTYRSCKHIFLGYVTFVDAEPQLTFKMRVMGNHLYQRLPRRGPSAYITRTVSRESTFGAWIIVWVMVNGSCPVIYYRIPLSVLIAKHGRSPWIGPKCTLLLDAPHDVLVQAHFQTVRLLPRNTVNRRYHHRYGVNINSRV